MKKDKPRSPWQNEAKLGVCNYAWKTDQRTGSIIRARDHASTCMLWQEHGGGGWLRETGHVSHLLKRDLAVGHFWDVRVRRAFSF